MGTKPPAAVDGRISKEGRHDPDAAAPGSTTTSSLQERAGGSAFTPKLVESAFGPGSTRRAEKPPPRIACTAVAAPSVRSRVFVVSAGPSASWQDVAAELHAPGILKAVPKVSISYPTSPLVVLKGSSSLDVHPPAQVGQTRFFLLGGRGHCPRGQPRSPSVACQGILSGEGH